MYAYLYVLESSLPLKQFFLGNYQFPKFTTFSMDKKIKFFVTLFCSFCAFVFFVSYLRSRRANKTKGQILPQPGGALPIIGHLHHFGGGKLTHKVLGAMAEKYGPAMTIRLGSHQALVISSSEMARECLTTHDKAFSDRPRIAASKILGYGFAMFGFAPYGTYWREMRKIATLELLSNRRIEMLRPIRTSELETSIREIYGIWVSSGSPENGVLVDLKQWFVNLTRNMLVRMVGGKRLTGDGVDCNKEEAKICEKVIREFTYLFGVFVLSDVVPFLGWFDLQGHKKWMKRIAGELDKFIEVWLKEHKKRRISGEGKEEGDFMDVLLEILEDAEISDFDADTINKATCLNMLLAGSDTTAVTLTWALSLLLNNRDVLDKVQEELDTQIGRNKNVEESDINNLVFLQAVIKETLRLYPASPIIGLHSSLQDCTLSQGYHVPADTRLMVNAWKIHRDERIWPEAHEFQPERFLTTHRDIDVRGQHFELIPFGSGRRSCPGISLALHTLHISLATLLHCFNFAIPSYEKIDMSESPGLTNLKATPLKAYLIPRLPATLFGQ